MSMAHSPLGDDSLMALKRNCLDQGSEAGGWLPLYGPACFSLRGWEIIPCRHVDQIQSVFASIHWTQVEKETYSVSVSAGSKGSG